MAQIRARRLRRAMIVRELASLGLWETAIARLCRCSARYVLDLAKRAGVVLPRFERKETPLRQAVRAGYAAHRHPADIARDLGTTEATVKVTASQMGLTVRDPHRFKRGFVVPADLRSAYRAMTRLGCTPEEAGQCLGLVPRTPPRYSETREATP